MADANADRCENCDRLDCLKGAPMRPEQRKLYENLLKHNGHPTEGQRRLIREWAEEADDHALDCSRNTVEWRDRVVAARSIARASIDNGNDDHALRCVLAVLNGEEP